MYVTITINDAHKLREQLLTIAWIDTFLNSNSVGDFVDLDFQFDGWTPVFNELIREQLVHLPKIGQRGWQLTATGEAHCRENALDVRAALLWAAHRDE